MFVYDWLVPTIKIGIIGGTYSALALTVGGVIVGIFRPRVGKPIVIAGIVCSALTVAAVVAGVAIISLGY